MGSAIAKVAFQPPPPEAAAAMLKRYPEYHHIITNSQGNPVSTVYIPPTNSINSMSPAPYTILFSHGNAEDLSNLPYYVDFARRTGAAVVAYDYTGYGLSGLSDANREAAAASRCMSSSSAPFTDKEDTPVKPTESATFSCANAVFDYAVHSLCVPVDHLIIVGRSLGSGPATHLASMHPGVRGLVLLSPLKSCAHVAGRAVGFFLHPFDIMTNVRKLNKVKAPTLVVHGTDDRVIPFKHAEDIVATLLDAQGFARLVAVPGADHNDVEETMGVGEFYRLMADFVRNPSAVVSACA